MRAIKVLDIKDQKDMRAVIVRLLQRENYLVEEAEDYFSAIDKIVSYN